MKHLKRIAAAGIAQIAIFAAVLIGFSGAQMGAAELPTSVDGPTVELVAPEVSEAPAEAPPTEISLLDSVFDETVFAGDFTGNGPFTVNGGVLAFSDGVGQRQLVLTNDFQTNRGQDLEVFLRSNSGQFVSLGDIQAVSGAQEFLIPGEFNLATFNEVQIRDAAFDVRYGSAFLSPIDAP